MKSKDVYGLANVYSLIKESSHKEEEGDLMSHMKERGMIDKDATTDTGKYGKHREEAEDMSKSPFHYDPMHGLASAAHKIRDELRSAANDEARPEHIEKMAEIILGPQSEYASVDHYNKALSGVIELLNHYVVVPMN